MIYNNTYQQKLIRIVESKNVDHEHCTYYQYQCLDRFIQFVDREYDFNEIIEISILYFSMFYGIFKRNYTDFLKTQRDAGEIPAYLIDAEIRTINSLV